MRRARGLTFIICACVIRVPQCLKERRTFALCSKKMLAVIFLCLAAANAVSGDGELCRFPSDSPLCDLENGMNVPVVVMGSSRTFVYTTPFGDCRGCVRKIKFCYQPHGNEVLLMTAQIRSANGSPRPIASYDITVNATRDRVDCSQRHNLLYTYCCLEQTLTEPFLVDERNRFFALKMYNSVSLLLRHADRTVPGEQQDNGVTITEMVYAPVLYFTINTTDVNCSDVPMAPPDLPMSATGTKVTIVDDLNNDDSNDGASDSNNGASADKSTTTTSATPTDTPSSSQEQQNTNNDDNGADSDRVTVGVGVSLSVVLLIAMTALVISVFLCLRLRTSTQFNNNVAKISTNTPHPPPPATPPISADDVIVIYETIEDDEMTDSRRNVAYGLNPNDMEMSDNMAYTSAADGNSDEHM